MSIQYAIPVLLALTSIGVVAILAIIFKRKNEKLITLQDPNVKYFLKLADKEEITHNVRRFRFTLPSPQHILGLPVGKHIYVSAEIDGKLVIRPYTPVTLINQKGFVDLILKIYFKDTHAKFPNGGKMSQHLNNLAISEGIHVHGPGGLLTYNGCGEFFIYPKKNAPPDIVNVKRVNMIAGGTGVTPMLQLIKSILSNDEDFTQMALLFANQTEDDILLRDKLDEIADNYPDFKVHYTVDIVPSDWKYSTGHINAEMIQNNLFPPNDDTLVLLCGPPPMIQIACHPNLEKLGYNSKLIYEY